MAASRRLLPEVLRTSLIVGALGLAIGPDFVFRRLAESLVAIRKTVGDSIIRHDIASLSRQLDAERDLLGRMEVRRDALVTRLQDLRIRSLRHRITAPPLGSRELSAFITGEPGDGGGHEPDSDGRFWGRFANDGAAPWAEDALAALAPEIQRVNDQIEAAEKALGVKARELFELEVTTEARWIRQELAGSGEPLSWSARVGRLTEFLQPIEVGPNSN